jgi:hypothetical protein
MSDALSVDLGSALAYLEDKVRAAVGYDDASLEFRELVDRHLSRAMKDAAAVQIIGMDRPVSIFDIYQTSTLAYPYRRGSTSVEQLVSDRTNGVIFGGPGRGKTILLHHTFATLAKAMDAVPLLFTLRWPGETVQLKRFVELFASGKLPRKRSAVVLLVDGFDEVPPDERSIVTEALRQYAALERGSFLLTCRSFYSVDDIKAQHLEIAPFTRGDALAYVNAFSRCYGVSVDADALLSELAKHRLDDFAGHPLMLAMICILRSGPMPDLPRTPLRLIQRAISTLTLRWDDSKGVKRHSRLPIDGEDRVRCMMSIAYDMQQLFAPTELVERSTSAFLRRFHRQEISPSALLLEIAQWYGILVPASEMQWTFVHRSIHDFLAAKHWVETGQHKVSDVEVWNGRAAYAACLSPDATKSILRALTQGNDLGVVVECFYNDALFDADEVAFSLAEYFARTDGAIKITQRNDCDEVYTEHDFFGIAPNDLLDAIARVAGTRRNRVRDALLAYSLAELMKRNRSLPLPIRRVVGAAYPGEATFEVRRSSGSVRVRVGDFVASSRSDGA